MHRNLAAEEIRKEVDNSNNKTISDSIEVLSVGSVCPILRYYNNINTIHFP